MTDAENQAFERDRLDSYDPENEVAALNQRLLRGLISRERVVLAATLGHPVARELASSFRSETKDVNKPQALVDSLEDLATLLSQEGRSVAAQAIHLLFQETTSQYIDEPPYDFSQELSEDKVLPSLDHDPLLRNLATRYRPYFCTGMELAMELMMAEEDVKSLRTIRYGHHSDSHEELALAICSILGSPEDHLKQLVQLGLLMAIRSIAQQLSASPNALPAEITVEDLTTPAYERLLHIFQEQLTPFLIQ